MYMDARGLDGRVEGPASRGSSRSSRAAVGRAVVFHVLFLIGSAVWRVGEWLGWWADKGGVGLEEC